MARTLRDIEYDIRALSAHERARLLGTLISDLDAPADPDVEGAWAAEAKRRLAEIESGALINE